MTKTQHRRMTDIEKVDTSYKACLLSRAGDEEGYINLTKTIPIPAYLAKFLKEKMGVDFLINGDWNLAEAEAEFGHNWLNN